MTKIDRSRTPSVKSLTTTPQPWELKLLSDNGVQNAILDATPRVEAAETAIRMANLVEDRNGQFLEISKDLFSDLTRTHLPSAVESEVIRRDAAQYQPSVEEAVRTYMRSQAHRELIKDVFQEVSREVSRDYFGSNEFRSLIKEETEAGMHELMSAYAGREACLDRLLTNARMQRTIGDFAVKVVKVAVENSPCLKQGRGNERPGNLKVR